MPTEEKNIVPMLRLLKGEEGNPHWWVRGFDEEGDFVVGEMGPFVGIGGCVMSAWSVLAADKPLVAIEIGFNDSWLIRMKELRIAPRCTASSRFQVM